MTITTIWRRLAVPSRERDLRAARALEIRLSNINTEIAALDRRGERHVRCAAGCLARIDDLNQRKRELRAALLELERHVMRRHAAHQPNGAAV